MIRATLDAFGVKFHNWASERELVRRGAVAHAIDRLRQSGLVFEEGGATWLRTTIFGPLVSTLTTGASTAPAA